MIRLNKYLAQQAGVSRRHADRLIEDGEVAVNDRRAQLGQMIDPTKDNVVLSGKPIKASSDLEYYLVNKPLGYVSTTVNDHRQKIVTDLVSSKQRLYPIGRLDQDSQGLIILTNDGDLTYKLTHPKHHIPKTYHALVSGQITTQKIKKLANGVNLKDGKTAPADIQVIRDQGNKALLEITIFEGRNRQIRRMVSTQKLEVEKLNRVAIGPITIGELESGQSRKLTPQEIQSLIDLANTDQNE